MPNNNVPGPNVATRGPNRKLTRRQEKFVKELVSNDGLITMREAAIRAGYPPASAHTRAYELTSQNICPHVVSEIARYRDELDEMYSVGYKRTIRDLQKIRFEPIIDITPEEVVEQDAEVSAKKPGKRAVADNKPRSKKKRAED